MKTSSITRGLALSALAAAALVAPAQPALAAATPQPIAGSFPALCPGFQVQISGEGKVGVIPLPGDRLILIWPKLTATVTGPTGKSVSFISTGVNRIQFLPDGSQYVTATGPNVIAVPDANGHPPGVFYTTGTVSWTLNPDGTEQGDMFSGSGAVTDVCALVAP